MNPHRASVHIAGITAAVLLLTLGGLLAQGQSAQGRQTGEARPRSFLDGWMKELLEGDRRAAHEIYTELEAATDRCEDGANVLEGIVLKHA